MTGSAPSSPDVPATDGAPSATGAPDAAVRRPWTSGPFPPVWVAVLGSLFVFMLSGFGLILCLVGAVTSTIVARRRPWVAATAIVLALWAASRVLATGRLF